MLSSPLSRCPLSMLDTRLFRQTKRWYPQTPSFDHIGRFDGTLWTREQHKSHAFCDACTSPRPADSSHFPAVVSGSAEELIATIGLKPRNVHTRRHLELLQDLSRLRINAPHVALLTFPGAVPELAVDPGDSGDEAVGRDGAKNGSRFGIDLMDLPLPILSHPERSFGPSEPGVTAAAGRRDCGKHTAGLGIDLLDASLGDRKEVLPVEGHSRMRCDINRALRPPTCRIEGVQLVSGRKPDVPTVIGPPVHALDTRKGSILAND